MTDLAMAHPVATARPSAPMDLLPMLCWVSIALGIACRLLSGLDTPLWFDETFSAVIASQDDLRGLVSWMLTELSGPTYYSFLFLWEKLVGNSDIMLRLPSLAFSIATPLLILWRGHPDRTVRMMWAAITALSIVGFDTATQARPYALLFLLATGQAIAFLRMIAQPRTGTAMLWTSISALMVLTHYHAAIICGFQGLAYIALHRFAALKTWPAILPLLPMGLWMAWHLPFIFSFTGQDTLWYTRLGPDALLLIPSLIASMAWPGVILIGAMLASFGHDIVAVVRRHRRWPYSAGETALVSSATIAMVLVLGMGFVMPSFTARYLMPFIPAVLAGVALWIGRLKGRGTLVASLLLCMMIGAAASQLIGYIRDPQSDFRYAFSFDRPTAWIAQQGARRMVVLWDNPAAGLDDPDGHIASVGGFFLRRAAIPMDVISPRWPRTGDPNHLLLKTAGDDPYTALLWAYDAHVPGTRGRVHPWRIPTIDPHWRCRDFGRAPITILACVRP